MSIFMDTAREAWGLVTKHYKSAGIASVIGVGVITLCTKVAGRVLANQARARAIRFQKAIPQLTREVEEYIPLINKGRKAHVETPSSSSFDERSLQNKLYMTLVDLKEISRGKVRFSLEEKDEVIKGGFFKANKSYKFLSLKAKHSKGSILSSQHKVKRVGHRRIAFEATTKEVMFKKTDTSKAVTSYKTKVRALRGDTGQAQAVNLSLKKLATRADKLVARINKARKAHAENPIFASAGFGYGQDLLKKQLDRDLTALNRMQSQYRFSIQEEALTSTSAIVAMLGISTVTSNYPELSLRVEKLS